jgi:hypothetical protein
VNGKKLPHVFDKEGPSPKGCRSVRTVRRIERRPLLTPSAISAAKAVRAAHGAPPPVEPANPTSHPPLALPLAGGSPGEEAPELGPGPLPATPPSAGAVGANPPPSGPTTPGEAEASGFAPELAGGAGEGAPDPDAPPALTPTTVPPLMAPEDKSELGARHCFAHAASLIGRLASGKIAGVLTGGRNMPKSGQAHVQVDGQSESTEHGADGAATHS